MSLLNRWFYKDLDRIRFVQILVSPFRCAIVDFYRDFPTESIKMMFRKHALTSNNNLSLRQSRFVDYAWKKNSRPLVCSLVLSAHIYDIKRIIHSKRSNPTFFYADMQVIMSELTLMPGTD